MRKHLFLALVSWGLVASTSLADPCGMVPPIYLGEGTPIARVGDQQTYVFFKDGIETVAIRPGFTGKTDEFGMLIPFPTPPAVRKVPDNIFAHIGAAIDPPEVVVNLLVRYSRMLSKSSRARGPGQGLQFDAKKDSVRVIRQEAVGMYEVAVLDAGSSAALKRWMEDHGYQFPDGMDKVCDDYVDLGWCFVAIKTRVAQKEGVNPKPGMRKVNSKLPAGSTFDGHVQAMGFRFEVEKLIVPMRLSAFNEGDLHNIVYLLTDGPRKIRSIPEEYVVRQISGEQLYRNLTELLPLRIIGGTEKDLNQAWRRSLKTQRDPKPKNGLAREMFAADLLAVSEGRLSHPHEEAEKALLQIGERLGLRGAAIDQQNQAALAAKRDATLKGALEGLKEMTLTVVDGDFPREVLGGQNLQFAEYRMPARRNRADFYDAKTKKPTPKQPGILKLGNLDALPAAGPSGLSRIGLWGSVLGLAMLGLLVFSKRRFRGAMAAVLLPAAILLGVLGESSAVAQDNEKEILALIDQLADAQKAEDTVDALVKQGEKAVPHLLGEALEGNSIIVRGWAIVCLGEIGGAEVNRRLVELHGDKQQSMLIRTWAAAAQVKQANSADELVKLAPLVSQFPALGRPIGMRLVEQLTDKDNPASVEDVLGVSLRVPQVQAAVAPAIMAFGSDKLVETMVGAKDNNVRNRAAAYLGTMAQQGDKKVAPSVVAVYKFNPKAKQVPWQGGALWIPGIQWDQENARGLVGNLVAWHLWCDRNGQKAQLQQIHNNLRSLQLARAAGYQSPGFGQVGTDRWLTTWGQVVGRDGIEKILAAQGVAEEARYKKILAGLK